MNIELKNNKPKGRESGIELLKIIAIFIIVISHVVQTLGGNTLTPLYTGYSSFIINYSVCTQDTTTLIICLLQYLGAIGNAIFFICSAWFLLESNKFSPKKLLSMILDVWFISVIILFVVHFVMKKEISRDIMLWSCFPTTFTNNWYVTCYVLFYPIHPLLNNWINKLSQQSLLKAVIVLNILYVICNFLWSGLYYESPLTLWIAIYFTIAYIKKYMKKTANSVKINAILLICATLCNTGVVVLTNYLGLHTDYFAGNLLKWYKNNNPLLILIAICSFNLFRQLHFKNGIINNISKLTLFIYVIHENLIIRTYGRGYMWEYIYENYGYKHILIWIMLCSTGIFIGAFILSFIYSKTIQRFSNWIQKYLYVLILKIYKIIEKIIYTFD